MTIIDGGLNDIGRRIAQQQAEIAKLRDETKAALADANQTVWDIVNAKNEKIQKLRAALEEIAALDSSYGAMKFGQIARKALANG